MPGKRGVGKSDPLRSSVFGSGSASVDGRWRDDLGVFSGSGGWPLGSRPVAGRPDKRDHSTDDPGRRIDRRQPDNGNERREKGERSRKAISASPVSPESGRVTGHAGDAKPYSRLQIAVSAVVWEGSLRTINHAGLPSVSHPGRKGPLPIKSRNQGPALGVSGVSFPASRAAGPRGDEAKAGTRSKLRPLDPEGGAETEIQEPEESDPRNQNANFTRFFAAIDTGSVVFARPP